MQTSRIKIQYSEVEQSARTFMCLQEGIAALRQELNRSSDSLRSGWQGEAADAFFDELDGQINPALARLANALETASQVSLQISAVLRSGEEQAAALFKNGSGPGAGMGGGGAETGGSGGAGKNFTDAGLDSIMVILDKFGGEMDKFTHGRLKYKDMLKSLGLGKIYPLLSKSIPYRGNLDAFFKSGIFEKGLVGLDMIFESYKDIRDGSYSGNLAKIIGVNGINSLMQYAVCLEPHVAVAMGINTVVQIKGNIEVGLQRTLAPLLAPNSEIAGLMLQNTDQQEKILGKIDLGNITKTASEAVFDVYAPNAAKNFDLISNCWNSDRSMQGLSQAVTQINLNEQKTMPQTLINAFLGPASALLLSERGRQGLWDTSKAALGVLDGLVDLQIQNTASSLTSQAVAQAHIANFFNPANQAANNAAAAGIIRAVQNTANAAIQRF